MNRVLTLIALFLTLIAFGQYPQRKGYDLIQNNPRIEWKQINTDNFRIIFPEEITKDALRVANTLEYLREPLGKTLNTETKRWKLLLTNRSGESNGYVRLAPRMSEWYSLPASGSLLGTGDWYNLLGTHEGRHLVQYDKFSQAFNKFVKPFFGQNAVELLTAISIPYWYWEGDAVCSETALSETGRGRTPEFDIGMRANLLSGKKFSYYQAYLQSYKNYFPNHYTLGYFMVAHLRRNYGSDAVNKMLDRTCRFSYSPFSFSRSMSKFTKKGTRKMYNEMMSEMKKKWSEQLSKTIISDRTIINNKKNKTRTDYLYPFQNSDGNFFALKQGMSDAPALYEILPSGKEKKIKQISAYDRVTFNNNKIVWNDVHINKRYGNESFSDIVMMDINKRKLKYLTGRGKNINERLYSPALSNDANKIAAIEFTSDRKCTLIILDANNGNLISRVSNDDNYFIQTPSWSEDDKRIVYTKQKFNGKILEIYNVNTNKTKVLINETNENISNPILFKNFIIYDSPFSEIDNIYAIDTVSLQRYTITSSRFGASNPSLHNNNLVYNDYDVKGYNIAVIALNPDAWKKLTTVSVNISSSDTNLIKYYEPLIREEQGKSIMLEKLIPKKEYEIESYSQTGHLINIHSWTLFPQIIVGPTGLNFGFQSNDILNTLSLQFSQKYNMNEKLRNTSINFTYSKFYPVFDVEAGFGKRLYETDNFINTPADYFLWKESRVKFSVLLPLISTKGVYSTLLSLESALSYTYISGWKDPAVDDLQSGDIETGTIIPVTYKLTYKHQKQSSIRDINPVIGQNLFIDFSNTPIKADFSGQFYSMTTQFFFPGLFKHHSLQLDAGAEIQNGNNYHFMSDIMFTRGYKYIYLNNEVFYKISPSYQMPLFYPDLSAGSVLYLKRIRATLFYDYGVIAYEKFNINKSSTDISDRISFRNGLNNFYFKGNGLSQKTFSSAGFELNFDFIPFTILPLQLSLGVRCSYRIQKKDLAFDALFMNIKI